MGYTLFAWYLLGHEKLNNSSKCFFIKYNLFKNLVVIVEKGLLVKFWYAFLQLQKFNHLFWKLQIRFFVLMSLVMFRRSFDEGVDTLIFTT